MFNLNTASESLRKAAALQGVWSGEVEPQFGGPETSDRIVATVYNRNHPNGLKITAGEVGHANAYTWQEIKDAR